MPKTEKAKTPIPLSKKLFYAGVIVVLVIVVITFVGLPILGGSSSQGGLLFGTYNGKDISYVQGGFFANTYEYLTEVYRSTLDNSGTNFDFQLRFLWRTAYDQSLAHVATLDAAEKSGIRVSSQKIDRTIVQSHQFNENGRFNINRYRAMPKKDLFNLQTLTSETLIYQQYYKDVISSTKISSQERAFIGKMASNQRSFRVMVFDQFPDEEALAWAEDNQELFQSITLESITVTESRQQAEDIQQQATSEESGFEELVKLHSKDRFANTGGSRGRTYFYELLREFSREDVETIFSSDTDVTPVLQNLSETFVFFRRGGDLQSFDATNQETVEQIQSYLAERESDIIQNYLQSEAEDFVQSAREIGFGPASEFNYVQTNAFPINYGNINVLGRLETDLPHLSTVVQREDFFLTLFALQDSEISDPFSVHNTVWVVQATDTRTLSENEQEAIQENYAELPERTKAGEYSEKIVDRSLLNEFFEETFNRSIRPQTVVDSPPSDADPN